VTLGVGDPRTGQPLTAGTTFPAPILLDPLLAIAVLRAAGDGSIALDAPIGGSTALACGPSP